MVEVSTAAVTYSVDGGVAAIKLNRPAASNALNRTTKEMLLHVLSGISADSSVRAVLLSASGRNFCVGQDLAEHIEGLRDDPSHAMDTVREHYNPIVQALHDIEVPIVAAINGACVGAGLGLALAADIRIAASGAKFSTAFTGIGLAADSALSATLGKLIGVGRASALFMLGDAIDATTAESWGLVNRVVADEELPEAAAELAVRLAAGPTAAYKAVKALLNVNASAPLRQVLDSEADAQQRLGISTDHTAAVEAFLAKTRPVFVGH